MSNRLPFLAIALAAVLFASAAPSAFAGNDHTDGSRAPVCNDDDDHEQARAAREDDLVLPLEDILEGLAGQLDGVIIEIEFECEDGLFVYEIAVRTAGGRIVEWLIDATTGELIGEDD